MLAVQKPLTSDLKRNWDMALPILAEIEVACHHGGARPKVRYESENRKECLCASARQGLTAPPVADADAGTAPAASARLR